MASCDDDFSLLSDEPQNPNHHHHHQTFNPVNNLSGSGRSPKKGGGATVVDGEEEFNSENPFQNVNSFGADGDADPFVASAAEDDDDSDPNKSRANSQSEKRKDREELSDEGFSYYKKSRSDGTTSIDRMPVVGYYKVDCRKDREEWSDTAINCLLDVYTEKFLQLNRGNLRGRDWEEVASIVSERSEKQKSGKSVEQCKNKVDNLKKRYKVELQRMNNNGTTVTHWPWFTKMEQIVVNSNSLKTVSDEDKIVDHPVNMIRQSKRYSISSPVTGGFVPIKPKVSLPNPRWRRVVFKISGASLVGPSPLRIDPKVTTLIAREVAMACRLGVEVAIVVGGRNFFCGDTLVDASDLDRSTAYQIGMMATAMNSTLLQSALEKLNVQARVQSAFPTQDISEPYSRKRAIRHLEKGRVVIFGGIGAGSGNPLFTTDTSAALRASEIKAEVVLKGTNAEGVYDCQGGNNNNLAFEHISYRELSSRGVTSVDMMAITFCEENRIPVVVFNLLEPGNISRALCGDQVGTLIDQTGRIS